MLNAFRVIYFEGLFDAKSPSPNTVRSRGSYEVTNQAFKLHELYVREDC